MPSPEDTPIPTDSGDAPAPASPAPGTITLGQSLHNGKIWVLVRVETKAEQLVAMHGAAQLTVAMTPELAGPIGEALTEMHKADQVVISRKEGLIVPGQNGAAPRR